MEKGLVDLEENRLSDVSNMLNRSFNNINRSVDDMNSIFSSVKRTGLISNSLGKVANQMTTISNGIKKVESIVERHRDKIFNTERILASKADSLVIPNDFVVNDSSALKSTDTITLDKDDGKSVVRGEGLADIDTEFNSSIEYNNRLKSIVSDYELRNGKLDDYKALKIKLEKMNSASNLESQQLADETLIKKSSLFSFNKDNNQEGINLDNTESSISKVDLRSVSSNSVSKDIENDFAPSIGKVAFKNINNKSLEEDFDYLEDYYEN